MTKKIKSVKKDKYVTAATFDRSMGAIANSFARVEEQFKAVHERFDRHENVMEKLLGEIRDMRQEAKEDRAAVTMLMRSDLIWERRISELDTRVSRLETKPA